MNFAALPLNTKRSYTMGVDRTGCEIYIPVHSDSTRLLELRRDELQGFLDKQPPPERTLA